jgi:hypothetical protein
MKSRTSKRWFWALLLIATLITAIVLAFRAPLMQGSTFSRAPSGYGAWYAQLQQQGIPIQRWQRPLEELFDAPPPPPTEEVSWNPAEPVQNTAPLTPQTLIKIATGRSPLSLSDLEEDWVRQGNVMVLVGVRSPVTKAPFSSQLPSPSGLVKVETQRRFDYQGKPSPTLLKDALGAVVWASKIDRGQLISIVTPHFAANAYQDEPGNFKFFTQLVTAPGNPIWIDEYSHGFRVNSNAPKEKSNSLAAYLAQTSLPVLAMQSLIILLVLIWGKNQRLGMPLKLLPPKVDNSEAYIQAMAGVLQKAECSEFVWETVGKAERTYIQRSLGLGSSPVPAEAIVDAWVQQTGRPAAELEEVLRKPTQKRPSRQELLTWLGKVQTLHRQLKNP